MRFYELVTIRLGSTIVLMKSYEGGLLGVMEPKTNTVTSKLIFLVINTFFISRSRHLNP